jgi:2-polyprenyl-6-hydroxyphenyl methylase/3-demethylubiquinone-9 3-methyltransferase
MGTIDESEIERFSRLAATWWDPDGPMQPLHRLNPLRIAYVRDRFAPHFGRDPKSVRPFAGLRLLDVGCGAGLLSEPMARLGFVVTAIDATKESIAVARRHAEDGGLAIDYRVAAVEDLGGEGFDAVLALEILEHVAEPPAFLAATAGLVRPGGGLVLSTLSRTAKSFLMAIVGAEYVLGWLPRGTHEWRRFVRPSELVPPLRRAGLQVKDLAGVAYDPLAGEWRLAPRDLDVNYMAFAVRPR